MRSMKMPMNSMKIMTLMMIYKYVYVQKYYKDIEVWRKFGVLVKRIFILFLLPFVIKSVLSRCKNDTNIKNRAPI